jgi:hypothetical protein
MPAFLVVPACPVYLRWAQLLKIRVFGGSLAFIGKGSRWRSVGLPQLVDLKSAQAGSDDETNFSASEGDRKTASWFRQYTTLVESAVGKRSPKMETTICGPSSLSSSRISALGNRHLGLGFFRVKSGSGEAKLARMAKVARFIR